MFRLSLRAILGLGRHIVPRMTTMARSEPIPVPSFPTAEMRQSMQDASDTVEEADRTVARIQRHIMRCEVVLRRIRLLTARHSER